MTDECLICDLMQDCESSDDLDKCCRECRSEIRFLLSERRAGEY